jgi:hypothetical protein
MNRLRDQLVNVTTIRQLQQVLHVYNLTITDIGLDINNLGVNVTRAIDQVMMHHAHIPYHAMPYLALTRRVLC